MVESDQNLWTAISSVINGNASAEQKELVNLWLKESEGNRKFYEIVSEKVDDEMVSTDEIKGKIFSVIESRVLIPKANKRLNFWVPAAAAVAAILITMSVFTWIINPKESKQVTYLESVTPYGVKSKIILEDSTIVYLNAGSRLQYPAQFNGKIREVTLIGEAYFEVYKDSKHPFIVKTSDVSVKVLGTHFNVKTFPEEDLFEASLLEGSILLSLNKGLEKGVVYLEPNQKASYKKANGHISVQKVNAELDASWKDGKFYFNNEYLPSILRALERNYNVPIVLRTGQLNNEVYTGLFNKNRTIYQTLDIMKLHKNFEYETRNDTIVIYYKKN